MRLIIAIATYILFLFCYNQANGQAVLPLGSFNTTVINRIVGGLKVENSVTFTSLADPDSIYVFALDATGKGYLKLAAIPVDSTIFATVTRLKDSIARVQAYMDSLYATIGTHDSLVKYTDTLTRIATTYGVDSAKVTLRNLIAAKLNSADTVTISNRINTKLTRGGDATGATLSAGTNDAFRFDLEANNTTAVTVHNGGNVTVGSTVDAGFKFGVTGTTRLQGQTTVSNVTNSNYVRTVTGVENPYIEIFDAGAQQIFLILASATGLTLSSNSAGTTLTPITVSSVRATTTLNLGPGNVTYTSGTGSPEGVLSAPVGSVYTNIMGGASTTLYIKASGAGNTGWVAK